MDLVGIGIGPANLSLAALLRPHQEIKAQFFDKRSEFQWHSGLMLPQAALQVPYLKDLVSLVDPTNELSFLSFLVKHKRLLCFINANFTQVAAQHTADICGLILLSTAGRPLGHVLREQLRSNPANARILDNGMSVLDSLESVRTVDATRIDPSLMPLFRPRVQPFLMSELAVDPTTLLTGYRKPVLIVQGLEDLQVGPADAQLLKRADPLAKLVFVATTATRLAVECFAYPATSADASGAARRVGPMGS
ncbi:lysine N(6)-hydroxylase/L-ornithine N(5)-oxygenase family protein [Paraburkholderia sp. GV072]|uniref:lysine N(6)-hydroxylase/L-ornithine N(5)-oxygenase family protein n=1 Tax=Paraburkholderia sp. GV072 TaxID=2135698 RepID=UPI00215971EE|nr:lysine N(6)-hydroxylase/L-ornithine N(5)-oxygenase family protein [Paraburkholderia sp. GV072]